MVYCNLFCYLFKKHTNIYENTYKGDTWGQTGTNRDKRGHIFALGDIWGHLGTHEDKREHSIHVTRVETLMRGTKGYLGVLNGGFNHIYII